MLIAGLDLAAEPKGSALAVIDWGSKKARLVSLELGIVDDLAVRTALEAEKFGIDCALGWPIDFVSFLNDHQNLNSVKSPFDGGATLRRNLAHRETDRTVREVTGKWPLSVSTDRLGMTAIRCAGLLSKMETHFQVDRSGFGRVVEVYPGATLRGWFTATSGYRNSESIRQALIEELGNRSPWLELSQFQELMIESCDSFDAVFAALAARAAQLGASTAPSEAQLSIAAVEGWIHLPTIELESLL
jgi:predicted nuclease with RNAse H fold